MHKQYFFTQDEGNIILSCIWIKRTINLNNNTYWRYVEVYISAWLNLHIIATKCLQIDKQMHEQMWTFKHWWNTSKQEYECICTWKKRSRYMYAHKHLCSHTHTKSMLTCILGMTSGSADMRAVISHMIMPREKMSACMMNENFDLFHWS